MTLPGTFYDTITFEVSPYHLIKVRVIAGLKMDFQKTHIAYLIVFLIIFS